MNGIHCGGFFHDREPSVGARRNEAHSSITLEHPAETDLRIGSRRGRILTVTGDAVGMRQQIRDRTEISGKQSGTTEE